jgi:p-cumate 2,3-dioxygenase beta subunit
MSLPVMSLAKTLLDFAIGETREMIDRAIAPEMHDSKLREEVEELLFYEAELLDQWRLDEWLGLFTEDCHYIIPTNDHPHGDPTRDVMLVHDDRFLLEQRIRSLQSRTAHAEFPHSRTRRLVTNIRAAREDDDVIAFANFAVYRMRMSEFDCYVGYYEHRLTRVDGVLRFRERKAVMDLEFLRPQGKVSILL